MSVPDHFVNYDLTAFKGRKSAMKTLMGLRLKEHNDTPGDIESFKPQFIDYISGEDKNTAAGEAAIVKFTIENWMLNHNNLVQPGILTAITDCVCGALAGIVSNDNIAGTLNMYTNFFHPLTVGDGDVTVHARMVENSSRIMHINAQVLNSSGQILMDAVTNIMKSM